LSFRSGVNPAFAAIIATCAIAAILAIVLRQYYVWENKRRDRLMETEGADHKLDIEFADVTDRTNKEFRYSL
jgi:hypothetical protein